MAKEVQHLVEDGVAVDGGALVTRVNSLFAMASLLSSNFRFSFQTNIIGVMGAIV